MHSFHWLRSVEWKVLSRNHSIRSCAAYTIRYCESCVIPGLCNQSKFSLFILTVRYGFIAWTAQFHRCYMWPVKTLVRVYKDPLVALGPGSTHFVLISVADISAGVLSYEWNNNLHKSFLQKKPPKPTGSEYNYAFSLRLLLKGREFASQSEKILPCKSSYK